MILAAGVAEAKQPWFWGVADAVTLALVALNLLLLAAVHTRRLRQRLRRRRARQFDLRLEAVLGQLDPQRRVRDPRWLRAQIASFDELERPVAAVALIERL